MKSLILSRGNLIFLLIITILFFIDKLVPFSFMGVKLGLANVVVIYSFFFKNKRLTFILILLKIFLILIFSNRFFFVSITAFFIAILTALWIYRLNKNISFLMLNLISSNVHLLIQYLIFSIVFNLNIWFMFGYVGLVNLFLTTVVSYVVYYFFARL